MRVLILADRVFASRERPLLARLEVGLADELIRVIHAVPEGVDVSTASAFQRVLVYSDATLRLTRGLAARRLVDSLSALGSDDARVDVVHVFGGAAWDLGAELAHQLGAALALEVWRLGLVERARTFRTPEEQPPVLLAPDPVIERALTGEGLLVRSAPWGVLAEPVLKPLFPAGRSLGLMVVGSGRDEAAWKALAHGLSRTLQGGVDALIFCDAVAARRSGFWNEARRLDLLPRVSLIEEMESRRDLLLHGDVLIQPEALAEQRSVLLDAMGTGLPILAAVDRNVSTLIDGRTARLVNGHDAAEWHASLSGMLASPEATSALVRSAHEFVRTQRRAAEYVRAVLEAYAWIAGDGSLPFRPQG